MDCAQRRLMDNQSGNRVSMLSLHLEQCGLNCIVRLKINAQVPIVVTTNIDGAHLALVQSLVQYGTLWVRLYASH